MMKVLWITSVYPSEHSPGTGVFHETQVLSIKKQGAEVSVICPLPQSPASLRFLKKAYKRNHAMPEVYERKGIKVYRPTYLAVPGQLRWAQPDKRIASVVLQTIQRYSLKPDLIHAHFAMPSGGATKRVADHLICPWLLTLHGSDVNVYPSYSPLSKRAFMNSVQSADHVIAVSKRLGKKAKEMTGKEIGVLPIGINLNQFRTSDDAKEELRKGLGLPLDKKLLVFVGRLTAAKGVNELIEALSRLPDEVAVVMVGEGALKEKCAGHPEFGQRLFMPGQVENEKVKGYLLAGDAFVLPSYTEGMPTVVIEALSLKCPVIGTKVGGMPELFGAHEKLLIEPGSVSGLVARIQEVLYQDIYTEEISQELYAEIQTNHNADHNAAELISVYKSLLPKILNKDNPFLYE